MRLLLTLNVGKQNKGMYSTITLAKKYIQYYFKASNGKGHGVHSPFVYLFIKEVLNKNKSTELFSPIEVLRNELLHNKKIVQVWDRGAGSRQTENNNRAICQIAKAALKPKKYSALLHHIVAYFKPANVLEMGTSLGITTSYLAVANPLVAVVTMEGAPTIADLARENFNKLGIQNIRIVEGDFDNTLPVYLNEIQQLGLAYVDGNHKYEPTIRYFKYLMDKSDEHTVLIFDDIHWSAEMELAWELIKNTEAVTLTIDLFFIGLVFFRKAQKEKEHFIIRF